MDQNLCYKKEIIQDIESDILIFADDISLFATRSDPAETVSQLTRDLKKISSRAKQCSGRFLLMQKIKRCNFLQKICL